MNDKYILICGGEGTDVVPMKCHSLDPELGTWDEIDMAEDRTEASSSLYGEDDYMLISGGRSLDYSAYQQSTEMFPYYPVTVQRDDALIAGSLNYSAVNLLRYTELENHTAPNYWLAEGEGRFRMDLGGHAGPVDMVELVNTYNGGHWDWAMKEFRVYLGNSSGGPWKMVVKETLVDTQGQTPPLPLQTFSFPEISAKFVVFSRISGYRHGGGLSYFAVKNSSWLQ